MITAIGADEPERIPGTVEFGWAFGQPYPITAAAPAVPWLRETRQDTIPLSTISVCPYSNWSVYDCRCQSHRPDLYASNVVWIGVGA